MARSTTPAGAPQRRVMLVRAAAALAAPLLACGGTGPLSTVPARAERRANIERDVEAALARCLRLAPEARAALDAAVGVLVFPTLVTAGVNGELAGDGALRTGPVFSGYYLLSATPNGAGPERVHALIFLFTTLAALSRFRSAPAWPLGEQDLALPLLGADGRLAPQAHGAAVLAIALGDYHVLPALTLKGLRVGPLDLQAGAGLPIPRA